MYAVYECILCIKLCMLYLRICLHYIAVYRCVQDADWLAGVILYAWIMQQLSGFLLHGGSGDLGKHLEGRHGLVCIYRLYNYILYQYKQTIIN